MTVKVKVRLTPEEKSAVPDWQEQVATFQRQRDENAKDKRERFRLVLHEGGHAQQFRVLGWGVKSHGPYVSYEDGELSFVLGSVSPVIERFVPPLSWEHGMTCIAGFWTTEHFTGVPDGPCAIQTDLKGLRFQLGENADLNEAVWNAEIMLEGQLSEPNFIGELKQACRDYEIDVYGTDEATEWGWKEYRPDLKGTRYRVGVTTTGYWGTLIVDHDDLMLVTEGGVFHPGDKRYGTRLEVRIEEPEKAGTHRVVQAWNQAAGPEAVIDYAGVDAKAFTEVLVNYEQPWEDRTGFEGWEDKSEPTSATETGAA